ncbi:hypothetical protein Aduo_013668 [Ancylostoma duodenale]
MALASSQDRIDLADVVVKEVKSHSVTIDLNPTNHPPGSPHCRHGHWGHTMAAARAGQMAGALLLLMTDGAIDKCMRLDDDRRIR